MNPFLEEALFALALEKPAVKRAALRRRLDALLAAHKHSDTLLATQAETVRLREDASAGQVRPYFKHLEGAGCKDGGNTGSAGIRAGARRRQSRYAGSLKCSGLRRMTSRVS
jgi:hypothetical protein